MISKRLPTSMPGPSRATTRSTDAVHSGQRSTSAKTSQTIAAGASISMLLSVIMYQMVHHSRYGAYPWPVFRVRRSTPAKNDSTIALNAAGSSRLMA